MAINKKILALLMLYSLTHVDSAHTDVICDTSPGGKITVDGVIYDMPDVMDCNFGGDWGGGGGNYEGGGGGGGGGYETGPDRTDRDISAKLQCALDNYSHADVKLTNGRTMKKVNAWAFGKQNSYGVWGYELKNTNSIPAGQDWKPIAGSASTGYSYGRLYNLAFQGGSYSYTGSIDGRASNSLSGHISDFEKSLFVAAHEASHLINNPSNEAMANWYGIYAVKRYREDGGAKCSGQPN